MPELEIIAPTKTSTITFALEPAYNSFNNLYLISAYTSGFSHWIREVAAGMTPDVHETNKHVIESACEFLDAKTWPSFPSWLEDLQTRDPYEMRDRLLEAFLSNAEKILGKREEELPKPNQLLEDQESFLSFQKSLYDAREKPFDRAFYEAEHALYQDPIAWKDMIIHHLRTMWEQHLARDWEHNLPTLQACVSAFEALDLSGKPTVEILRQVFDRDIPDEWEELIEGIEEIILIPSAHIGPYLLMISLSETTARIIFGARIPKGVPVRSAALSRSELITRMSALADDTRLSILHLLSQEAELSSQEIMTRLDLSQSATSRHLRQLSATGYIIERRKEAAKYYRLNPNRLEDMFKALKEFLQ
jgi:ArsR family transcriptional regulator